MSYDIEYCKKYEPVFGSWYIKKKLGEGNFGAVFEIEREDFGTRYHAALKVISIPKNRSELESIMNETMDETATEKYIEQVVERIVKEFELMAKLKGNSNVVSYEDHQVIRHEADAGWDILIRMELLTPMLTYFKTREVTRKDVINVGIDICRALELCQKHNIIHRDIKPENIFVSEAGDFKLGDFGIAKQVEEAQSELTKIGTPTYMAPEVVKGEPYDASVDMYSLGVVLYRFLNHNRIPFMPQYPAPVDYGCKDRAFGERVNGGRPFPAPSNAGSTRLSEVIIKACNYSPRDRYSSPSQMRRALEEVLAKESDSVLSVSVNAHTNETAGTMAGTVAGAAFDGKSDSGNYERTSLLETQNRYTIGVGENVVLENTTDAYVTLTRVDKDPIEIAITNSSGEKMIYSPWRGLDITLSPGERVNIKNTTDGILMFYGRFGEGADNEAPDEAPTKKAFPVLLAVIAVLAVIVIAVVAILGGKSKDGDSGKEIPATDDIPVVIEEDVAQNTDDLVGAEMEASKADDEEEDEMPDGIAGLPEELILEIGQIYELTPEIPDEAKNDGSIIYTSNNKKAAVVGSDGSVVAMAEGTADITVKYDGAETDIPVTVIDKEKAVSDVSAHLAEIEAELVNISDNSLLKDIALIQAEIDEISKEYEAVKATDLTALNAEELMIIGELATELTEAKSELSAAYAELPQMPCPTCGSEEHSVHPRCSYCGSTSHTRHPQCTICGSKDHVDSGHPRCSYCGSTSHTTHPQCNICGSMEHSVHPAISADI